MQGIKHDPAEVLIAADIFWAASKSRVYRHQVSESFAFLNGFLNEKGLSTRRLPEVPEEVDSEFALRVSDLTEEGVRFYVAVEQKYFRAVDRAKDIHKIKVLERELALLRRT